MPDVLDLMASYPNLEAAATERVPRRNTGPFT